MFDDLVSINLNATFDPYSIDEDNRRINTFHIKNGGGLVCMTSANINTNFALDNKTFKKDPQEEEEEEEEEVEEEMSFNEFERLSGGGRDDDLFGKANDFQMAYERKKTKRFLKTFTAP